jgi:hypothetical protein
MSVQVVLTLKEFPNSCDNCPFYSEPEYRVHNERGNEAHCALGFMRGHDMRDVSFRKHGREGTKHFGCRLEILKPNSNESIH